MSSKPSVDGPIDLIALVTTVAFLKLSGSFMTCSIRIQLQGITAPPPARRFLDHFCAAGGMDDAFDSTVVILK